LIKDNIESRKEQGALLPIRYHLLSDDIYCFTFAAGNLCSIFIRPLHDVTAGSPPVPAQPGAGFIDGKFNVRLQVTD